MRKVWIILALLCGATGSIWHWSQAQAARGAPGSSEFGYGAWLEMDGLFREDALAMASDLPLDWVAISFSWNQYNLDPATSPEWKALDSAMQFAAQNHLAVMFSLTDAPPDVMTSRGPDAELTALLVQFLAKRYPDALQAVELYPGANTRQSWGNTPDPKAYMALYRRVQAGLNAEKLPVLLVAGGLVPVMPSSGDMDDALFLEEMYAANENSPIPVISVGLSGIDRDPLANPTGENPNVLRHYELIRSVMAKLEHKNDLIWVTSIEPVSGTIKASDQTKSYLIDQANWYFQAYTQLRAQLYIGVAFYRSLNPAAQRAHYSTLILNSQDFHPFYWILRTLLPQNPVGSAHPNYGRPKDEVLVKKRS